MNLATAVRDNKICFYKYNKNQGRAKENLHPLMGARGNVVLRDEEKVFFASDLNSKTSPP